MFGLAAGSHSMSQEEIINICKQSHPQLTALLLILLQPEDAASILSHLPLSLVFELSLRILQTETADPLAISTIHDSFKNIVTLQSDRIYINRNDVLIDILLHMNYLLRRDVILYLREIENIAISYTGILIVEDIVILNDTFVCDIVRSTSLTDILSILRIIPEEVKAKILSCYPDETIQQIKSDLEWGGSIRVEIIARASQKLVTRINTLLALQ